MPDAMGAAHVNGLRDRLWTVSFARVDRAVDVVVAHELKCRAMVLGREICLCARQIEAHHATALVRHGQLRHLVRRFRRNIADPADDDVRLDAIGLARSAQAIQHRFHDLGQLEPALRVQHGRVAHLHVANVFTMRVFRELEGDAFERRFALHHAQRDVEAP